MKDPALLGEHHIGVRHNGSASNYNLDRSVREKDFDLDKGKAFVRKRRKAADPAKGG